jgi:hypothetical protein
MSNSHSIRRQVNSKEWYLPLAGETDRHPPDGVRIRCYAGALEPKLCTRVNQTSGNICLSLAVLEETRALFEKLLAEAGIAYDTTSQLSSRICYISRSATCGGVTYC